MNDKTRELMFSSKSDYWETPKDFYDRLDNIFHFTLDPCTSEENKLGTRIFYTEKDNGLLQSWVGENVFINPPFSSIGDWVKKADCEDAIIVMLIPTRTDTKWFHNSKYKYLGLIKGRLKFDNPALPSWRPDGSHKKSPAPFPSMLLIYSELSAEQLSLLKDMNILIFKRVINM